MEARKIIAEDIEGSGNLDRDAKEAFRYQCSLNRETEALSNTGASEKKSISKPSLRTPKYKAPPDKVDTSNQGEESDEEFDAMLDNQLGAYADNVPLRDEDEEVSYMSVKMTVIEGVHPLERLIKGFTDLVHYVTIADESAEFQGLYSNQEVDPIKL